MQQRQRVAIAEFVSDRTPRPLMGPLLQFDLSAEAAALRRERQWDDKGHNARTLVKHSEFRLVLIVMGREARIDEQTLTERICLQTLAGALDVHASGKHIALRSGRMVALGRSQPVSIEATEVSELLMWIGWSKD